MPWYAGLITLWKCIIFSMQISMSVMRTLITALKLAQTLLVATNVAVMMDIFWILINIHAKVCLHPFLLRSLVSPFPRYK